MRFKVRRYKTMKIEGNKDYCLRSVKVRFWKYNVKHPYINPESLRLGGLEWHICHTNCSFFFFLINVFHIPNVRLLRPRHFYFSVSSGICILRLQKVQKRKQKRQQKKYNRQAEWLDSWGFTVQTSGSCILMYVRITWKLIRFLEAGMGLGICIFTKFSRWLW